MDLKQHRARLTTRKTAKEWWDTWTLTHAATFHLNSAYYDKTLYRWIPVEHERTLKHFSNALNRQAFTRSELRRGAKLAIVAVKQKKTNGNGYHCHLAIGGFPKGCDPHKAIEVAAMKTKCISKKTTLFNEESIKAIWKLSGWTSYMVREMQSSDDILIEQPAEQARVQVEHADNMIDSFFTI